MVGPLDTPVSSAVATITGQIEKLEATVETTIASTLKAEVSTQVGSRLETVESRIKELSKAISDIQQFFQVYVCLTNGARFPATNRTASGFPGLFDPLNERSVADLPRMKEFWNADKSVAIYSVRVLINMIPAVCSRIPAAGD